MTTAAFLAAIATLSVGSALHAQAMPRVYTPQFDSRDQPQDAPAVQVWLDNRSYRYGDILRPYVATEDGAYLTVIRVSTDGELRVLYPEYPASQRPYREGLFSSDRLPVTGEPAFYVKESAGSGFVFAIASFDRFDYRYYSSGNRWSYARLANAGRFGNPFEIARSFVEEVTSGVGEYSMDYVMYDVYESHYHTRYASRYRAYDYYDYLGLCLGAFGTWYSSYCRAYDGGYYGPYIIVNRPSRPRAEAPANKGMSVKPLVVDPALPHNLPVQPQPAEGRFPVTNPAEAAADARRSRMRNSARRRVDPGVEPMSDPRIFRPRSDPSVSGASPRSEPRSEPRESPRRQPRSEPRTEPRESPRSQPRSEPRRAEPREQSLPRVEISRSPPPPQPRSSEPGRVEKPKKDN